MFDLLAVYGEQQSASLRTGGQDSSLDEFLDQFLDQFDFAGITPYDIYHTILGRYPESIKAALGPKNYSPRHQLRSALLGKEFQSRIISLLLNAYPEKQRLLFVHVPKCAGTDLRVVLSTCHPSLGSALSRPNWTTKRQLFAAIQQFGRLLRSADTIFVHGHVQLAQWLDAGIARPKDRVISVIRDPIEIIISQVNYIITRILADQTSGNYQPDTQGWLERLGIERLPAMMSETEIRSLAKTIIHDEVLTNRNTICRYLGNGDVRSFFHHVVVANVELTDTEHYSAWLSDRWSIHRQAKANVSTKYVTAAMLDAEDRRYVDEISIEDQQVYALISEQLRCNGGSSIFGREITGLDTLL